MKYVIYHEQQTIKNDNESSISSTEDSNNEDDNDEQNMDQQLLVDTIGLDAAIVDAELCYNCDAFKWKCHHIRSQIFFWQNLLKFWQ